MNLKQPLVIDISHWETVTDFSAISPKPVLIISKATEGVSFKDDKFSSHFVGTEQAGIGRGAYHFHRRAYSGMSQAQHFCNVIQPYVTAEDILILDVEEGGESVGQLQAFFDYVHAIFPSNRLMIYSRKNLLDALAMTEAQRNYFKQIPVWTAGYPYNPDLFNTVPAAYVPDQTKWGPVYLWQYNDLAIIPGIVGGADVNWIAPEFLEVLGNSPLPEEEEAMGTSTYENNVRVIEGQYSGWDFRAIVIPPAAINTATLYRPSATRVENVTGDIVFNLSPFDNQGNPNLGLRINNTVIKSYVDFNPFIYWASKRLFIAHPKTTFNAQATAGQGFRYLIQNGVKNPLANNDWNYRSARRVMATNAAGDTVLLTVKGISGQEAGLTLHEVCALLFSLGLGVTWAMDGDSGGSAQDYILIDGVKQVFRGDDNEVRNVPVFGVIKLIAPLTGGTVEPPPVDHPPADTITLVSWTVTINFNGVEHTVNWDGVHIIG